MPSLDAFHLSTTGKALAPHWEEAATALKEQNIKLAKVDCTAETELCSSFGIQGRSPSISAAVRTSERWLTCEAGHHSQGTRTSTAVAQMRSLWSCELNRVLAYDP